MEELRLELTLTCAPDEDYGDFDIEVRAMIPFIEDESQCIPPLQAFGLGNPLIYAPVLHFTTLLATPLAATLGAWLHARYGRKVRIKVGDIEVEAQTPEQVAKLLDKAQEVRERNEPKRIIT